MKRTDAMIQGRTIGTFTGWDGDPDVFILYDFEPKEGVALPKCSMLQIDLAKGHIGASNDETGEVENALDLPTFLAAIPRDDA